MPGGQATKFSAGFFYLKLMFGRFAQPFLPLKIRREKMVDANLYVSVAQLTDTVDNKHTTIH